MLKSKRPSPLKDLALSFVAITVSICTCAQYSADLFLTDDPYWEGGSVIAPESKAALLTNGDWLMTRGGWMLRTNENSDFLWQKALDPSAPYVWDEWGGAQHIGELSDGDLFYVKRVDTLGVHSEQGDRAIVRLDPTGDVIWSKRLQDIGSYTYALPADNGSLWLLSTMAYPDKSIQVLALDDDGNVQWKHKFLPEASAYSPYLDGAKRTSDGGAFLFGQYPPYGQFIIRFSPEGNLIWAKGYDFHLNGYYMVVTSTDELLLTGYSSIARLSSDGTITWCMSAHPSLYSVFGISELDDSDILCFGHGGGLFGGPVSAYRVLLNSSGTVMSSVKENGPFFGFSEVLGEFQGQPVLASHWPMALCRLPSDGLLNCSSTPDTSVSFHPLEEWTGYAGYPVEFTGSSTTETLDDLILVESPCEWTIGDPCSFPYSVADQQEPSSPLDVFPVPAHQGERLTVTWEGKLRGSTVLLNDVSGREVKNFLPSLSDQYTIDTADLVPGLYFIRVTALDGMVRSGRAIVN